MSKGSKSRITDKKAYDAGYERIFMKEEPPTLVHKPLPRNIEEALDQLRELMIKDGHNYAQIRGLEILRKE